MIYDFKCDACEKHSDVHRKVKDMDNPVTCEECGGPMRRLISPVRTAWGPEFHTARMNGW